ncbi:hypothetical protein [Terrisporobacter vanillatitrophus]|uniref:hypothetical protein n=1 Tax=Terrisporobacter vanillatitrophus TaxID=3058402 RepID=UPI003367DECC
MKKINILKWLNILLCLFYGLSVVYLIFAKKYNYAAICTGCIMLTYILRLANKKFDYLFNDMLIIMLDLFILFSLVLGTSYGLYKINHYDDILHIWSGAIGSMVAYTIINVYTKNEDRKNIKKVFFFIFISMFSLAIVGLWEILEFTLDLLFKINCQAGGLNDTMIDMVDGLIGTVMITPFLLHKL